MDLRIAIVTGGKLPTITTLQRGEDEDHGMRQRQKRVHCGQREQGTKRKETKRKGGIDTNGEDEKGPTNRNEIMVLGHPMRSRE